MKKQTKQLLVASTFAFALATGTFGVATWGTASADVQTNANIAMIDGASLRLEDEDLDIKFGLRFKTEINQAWYDKLTNPQVYTLLLPTDLLNDGELTVDSKTTLHAIEADVDETKKYVVGENYRFNVVLTDIPEEDYSRDISVRSYVVSDEGTYYATNIVSRSVVYVANGAIELDIENGENKYEAVEKYLVSGVSIVDTGFEINGRSRSLNASVSYREGVSQTVQNRLNEKYPMSYSVETTTADASFDENGKFSATAEGTTTVKATCGNLGSATATVMSYLPTYGELFNFDAIDVTQLENFNSAIDLKAVSYNEQQAISYEQHSVGTQEYVGFNAYTPTWFRDKKFDTATITVCLNEETGDTSMSWLFLGHNDWSMYQGNANYQLSNAGEEKEFTIGLKNGHAPATQFDKNSTDGICGCAIITKARNTVTAQATFYVTNVSFGINDIESFGETVNLYDKFYTDANSATFTFTPNGSATAEQILNPEAFVANKSGTVTASISAEGYQTGTVTANYARTILVDFSAPIDTSSMKTRNTALNLRSVAYGDGYAIAFDFEHTEQEVGQDEYFGITMPKPEWIANFETVTITATLLAETGTSSTYLFYNVSDNTNFGILDDVGNVKTMTFETTHGEFTKNGVINLFWKLRQRDNVVSGTIIITDITFS